MIVPLLAANPVANASDLSRVASIIGVNRELLLGKSFEKFREEHAVPLPDR